jgi:hypothetical protein
MSLSACCSALELLMPHQMPSYSARRLQPRGPFFFCLSLLPLCFLQNAVALLWPIGGVWPIRRYKRACCRMILAPRTIKPKERNPHQRMFIPPLCSGCVGMLAVRCRGSCAHTPSQRPLTGGLSPLAPVFLDSDGCRRTSCIPCSRMAKENTR